MLQRELPAKLGGRVAGNRATASPQTKTDACIPMSRIKTGKFLSYVLRHRPDSIGITLDKNGWVDIDELLTAARANGKRVSRQDLEQIVATNDKKRFAVSDDGRYIRACQGHSVSVDLDLAPTVPPEFLYHGTVERFLDSIRAQGLVRGNRHHVHLSPDEATAQKVGSRRGKPVILIVEAAQMHQAGHQFFRSANNVWLTEKVPVEFLREL
jgi:putative RNA 2'-phosphotransferase